MIDDLKLNEHHHLRKRFDRLIWVSYALSNVSSDGPNEAAILERATRRNKQLSSFMRVMLAEKGYSVDVD